MFPSEHSLYFLSNLGRKIDFAVTASFYPKLAVTTYLICCISVICSSLRDGILVIKQSICNITLPVCISFPNSLGSKYVQQIAFGNINKDCHSELYLLCWQTEKKHTFTIGALYYSENSGLCVGTGISISTTVYLRLLLFAAICLFNGKWCRQRETR